MAKKIVKEIVIKVSDKGTLKVTTKEVDKLNKAVDKSSAANKKHSKSSQTLNRNMKGISRQSSNASKNFSKQAQGMQGVLVPAYAEIAARVFALTAAFTALSNAANYSILLQGQETYAQMTGKHMGRIAKSVQIASKHMLDFKEASTSVALASTSGITSKQIVRMTEAAVNSSAALGRSVSDTMDRLTRGIVKAEPEILDEIGVIIRLDKVYRDYAESVSKSTTELTEAEKASARYTAILGQLETKFGGIADKIDPNYFAALSSTVLDIINMVSSKGVNYLAGPLKFLTDSKTLLVAIMAIILKSLVGKIFPAFGAFGQKIADMPEKMAKKNKLLTEGITKLRQQIRGSKVELEKFNKIIEKTDPKKQTAGMIAAAKDKDIRKYTKLDKAALDRAQKGLIPGGKVKRGIHRGATQQDLNILKAQNKELEISRTKWEKLDKLTKKHIISLKGVQLGYRQMKLGIAKIGAQQVELMNMTLGQSILQVGRNWVVSSKWGVNALNTVKVVVSTLTIGVKALGAAINMAFKAFMWITMLLSIGKMIVSIFYDFDTPFKKAAEAASTLNEELKETLENLKKRPDSISFDGMASNFADALKNANFAANLAEEIYNATYKAMKELSGNFSEMDWLDRLMDKVKEVLGIGGFRSTLQESLTTTIELSQISGVPLPKGLQLKIDEQIASNKKGLEEERKSIETENDRMQAMFQGGQSGSALNITNPKLQFGNDASYLGNFKDNELDPFIEIVKSLKTIEADSIKQVIEGLDTTKLSQFLKEELVLQEEAAEKTKLHATNLRELGQSFNKIAKDQKAYSESIVSKTEYYELAKSQQVLQNIFNDESVTSSEKALAGIAAGYIKESEALKDLQEEIKTAREANAALQRGENLNENIEIAKEQKATSIQNLKRLTEKITSAAEELVKSLDVTEYNIVDWIKLQEGALKIETKKLGLQDELNFLNKVGKSTFREQAAIKSQLLQYEADVLWKKIQAGELDTAALANVKEQLRIKLQQARAAGATAYSTLMNKAAISGETPSLAAQTAAKIEDVETTFKAEELSTRGGSIKNWLAKEQRIVFLKLEEIDKRDTLLNKIQKTLEADLERIGIERKHWKDGKKIIALRVALAKIERDTADYVIKQAKKLALLKTREEALLSDIRMAKYKEETEWLGNAMNTIANSFGSSISAAFNDLFMNKEFDGDKFRTSLAQGFASAGSKILGDLAQKAVFSRHGLLAGALKGLIGSETLDVMFPKSELELLGEQLVASKKIRTEVEAQTETIITGASKQATQMDTSNGYLQQIALNTARKDYYAEKIRAEEFSESKVPNPHQSITRAEEVTGSSSKEHLIELIERTRASEFSGTSSKRAPIEGIYEGTMNALSNKITTSIKAAPIDVSGTLLDQVTGALFGDKGLITNLLSSLGGTNGLMTNILKSSFTLGKTVGDGLFGFITSLLNFQNGGVVPGGFRAFANGGIATRPTFGMIGEGRYNEAVVPLPDGKSIPIKGKVGNTNNVTINVSVDSNGQSAATETTGNGAKELGHMLSQAVQQELVEQQRPGGLLSAF